MKRKISHLTKTPNTYSIDYSAPLLACLLLISILTPAPILASPLIYVPQNPSFGGSPINGSVLMSSAQAQNKIKDPGLADDDEEETPLDEFNERLQRALLSRLTNTLSDTLVDDEGNLVPGTTETSDFTVIITDLGDGEVRVETVDRATGDSTIFTVQSRF